MRPSAPRGEARPGPAAPRSSRSRPLALRAPRSPRFPRGALTGGPGRGGAGRRLPVPLTNALRSLPDCGARSPGPAPSRVTRGAANGGAAFRPPREGRALSANRRGRPEAASRLATAPRGGAAPRRLFPDGAASPPQGGAGQGAVRGEAATAGNGRAGNPLSSGQLCDVSARPAATAS